MQERRVNHEWRQERCEEIATFEEWQASIYLFLARLFRQSPDQEILRAIADRLLDDLFDESDGTIYTLANILNSEVENHHNNLAAYAAKLNADYTNLFIGPGPLRAPPWEPVYRSQERIFGKPSLTVRQF